MRPGIQRTREGKEQRKESSRDVKKERLSRYSDMECEVGRSVVPGTARDVGPSLPCVSLTTFLSYVSREFYFPLRIWQVTRCKSATEGSVCELCMSVL